MSAENKLKELKKIKLIAKTNGYSEEFVDMIHKKNTLRKIIYDTKNEDFPRAAITYYPAITN
jgi:hypothetical protein